jgi:hypothetical protein
MVDADGAARLLNSREFTEQGVRVMARSAPAALAAVVMMFAAQPASTAAPGLSGKYFAQGVSICQPSIQVIYTGGSVNNINVTSPGSTLNLMTIAKFDPTKLKVTLTGVANQGSALLLADNVGHSFGMPFAGGPVDAKYPWSNTDTTVTINGVVFQAVYGNVKGGIADGFMLEGIDSGGCSVSISGHR